MVARRPLRSSARASRNAPVQTDATRRERCAADCSQAISRSSRSAVTTPRPPATSNVSIASERLRRGPSGTSRKPLELAMGAPSPATSSSE